MDDSQGNEADGSRQYDLAWGLTCELRKEIVESIKLVHQITALKATFISGSLTILFANIDKDFPHWIIAIPVMSMVFFDSLADIRRFVMFRNGFYIREHLEPVLRVASNWPESSKLWQEFLHTGQHEYKIVNVSGWGINVAFSIISIVLIFMYEEVMVAFVSSLFICIAFFISLYIIDPRGKRRRRF